VHNRDSDEAMLTLLREPALAALRADFHSFAGSQEMAAELRACGFSFGFSGMVTFRKADNIRALLAATPLDRILVETDSPYLAPVPHRGQPNRPAWVVAERVALERRCCAPSSTARLPPTSPPLSHCSGARGMASLRRQPRREGTAGDPFA
jgi:TatD DNase family protein